MIDKALAIGGSFDWISPLVTLLLNFRRRPSVGYVVPADTSWGCNAIARLLRERGVQVWGIEYDGGSIVFRVRRAQAEYAQYWLERNGIPYAGGVAPGTGGSSAPGAARATKSTTAAQAAPVRPVRPALRLDGLLEVINRAADKLV